MNFKTLFALEWVKLYSRRTLIYFIVYLLFAVGLSVLGLYTIKAISAEATSPLPLEMMNPFGLLLGNFTGPLAIISSLFFIMQSGDEYKHGVVRKNVIDGMSRNDVFYGKMIFLFGSYLGWMFILFTCFLITGMIMVSNNISGLFGSIDYNQVIRFLLYLFFYGAFGHFLVTLTRSATISILILLGVVFTETIVAQILNGFDYGHITKYFPFETAAKVRTADQVPALSLGLFLGYLLMFLGLSHFIFIKRDL